MRILNRLIRVLLLLSCTILLSACDSVEERAEKHYQSAIVLIAEGDVDRAIVELRNATDLDSGHLEARRALAELHLTQGNRQAAYGQYLRLAETNPDDLDSRVVLSEMAFSTGSWEEFNRHGAQAERLDSDNPRVQIITLVRAYRTVIDNDASARRDLADKADDMLVGQPQNVLLRNTLIDNALREQDFTRALAEIDWMINFEPTNISYYQERLRVLATIGDMAGVEAQLREMIAVFPEDPTHLQTLVRFHLSRKNLDAAEKVLREQSVNSSPDNPGATINLIHFLTKFRDSEAVRAEFKKALAVHSDQTPFTIIEAGYEFSKGNENEAIAMLQGVLANVEPTEQSAQSRSIKITLAKMLFATGNEVGARIHVEEVLADDPTYPDALKMLAAWQIEADDTDAAIGGLRVALDKNAQDADAMTLIASAYTRAGQPGLASDFLAQAVEASGNAPTETLSYARLLIDEERFLPAEDILLSALRLVPTDTGLLVTLGYLYLEMGDFGRAKGVTDSLRRIGDEVSIQSANEIEAEGLNRQQGADSAITFLEDLANNANATIASKVALVRARLATGDYDAALALAEDIEEGNPDSEVLSFVLAIVEEANGNLEQAAALYSNLLAANPDRPRIWLKLSQLQLREGNRDAAKTTIDEGLAITQQNADLLWAKASHMEWEGDIDSAIQIYQILYDKNSDSVVVANNLASLLSTYREDAVSLDRAWKIARRFNDTAIPALQDTYGWILHLRESSAESLPYLEAAAQALTRDAVVQYHLGQVYMAQSRPADALAQFRKAVALAGLTDTRPAIEEARALVQSLQNGEVEKK